MIKVYKNKTILKKENIVRVNDVFFNMYTASMLDEKAANIIWRIDRSKMLGKYAIASRFDETVLNIDKLSTGCKTALNIMYNPDTVFDISECGDNALEVIYSLEDGKIYCDYPMIAFNMEKVEAIDEKGGQIIDDYDKLRAWWNYEN